MTEAVSATNTGIVSYLEGLRVLIDTHKDTVACGNSNIDTVMERIMETSYRATVEHMILCEALNRLTTPLSDNGRIRHVAEHCQFTLKPTTLEWAFIKSGGVQIDTNKIENDIISESKAARALHVLSTLNHNSEVDMIDLVNAHVEFIVAVFESGKAKVDEVNADIQSQLLSSEAA